MISLQNITLSRSNNTLLKNVNITLYSAWKIGITGENGCGKSSLFELILGQLHSDQGECCITPGLIIATVEQEIINLQLTALDYVLTGDQVLLSLQQRLLTLQDNNDGHEIAQIHDKISAIDGYQAETRAKQLLAGLGFDNAQFSTKVQSFSGGWRMRLNIARALMCRSDILLLDEPTNHLDLEAVVWLENWLKSYSGMLLLISHDRDFLDHITSHMMHIEDQRIELFTGNYTQFEANYNEQLAQQQIQYDKQQKQITHLNDFIRRFKAKASKAKQAQSRIKTLEKMKVIAAAQSNSPFQFTIPTPDNVANPLIKLTKVDLGYDHPILCNINFVLRPGDKISLLGHNGVGKSTFINALSGKIKPLSGEIHFANQLTVGYFAQHQIEYLDLEQNPVQHILTLTKTITEQQARNYLGGFNFKGEHALRPVSSFSGGEKARLALALMVWRKPNVLLLDEPTNHLDIKMRSALMLALQEYEGAIIMVSHDRHLLNCITEQFYAFENNKITAFDGTLIDFHKKNRAADSATKKSITHVNDPFENRKKQSNYVKKVARDILSAEAKINKLTEKKLKIEHLLADNTLYDAKNKSKLERYIAELATIERNIEDTEETWLTLHDELE